MRLARTIFQPSLPLRGATRRHGAVGERRVISTLAPLAGSDIVFEVWHLVRINFNPRSPCGERLYLLKRRKPPGAFQPSLPLRGATTPPSKREDGNSYFNPRSPCGERPLYIVMDAPLIARCSDSRALAPSTTYIPLSKYTWNRCEPTGRTLIATSSHLCACE